jgi:putative transposase
MRIDICAHKINPSFTLADQNVPVKIVPEKIRLVTFMQYDLGFFDHRTVTIASAENSFGARKLAMCPERPQ